MYYLFPPLLRKKPYQVPQLLAFQSGRESRWHGAAGLRFFADLVFLDADGIRETQWLQENICGTGALFVALVDGAVLSGDLQQAEIFLHSAPGPEDFLNGALGAEGVTDCAKVRADVRHTGNRRANAVAL